MAPPHEKWGLLRFGPAPSNDTQNERGSDDRPSRIWDSDPGRGIFTIKSNCLREAEKPAGPPPS